ncbi:hypothetical protein C8J57DRAFT_1458083 [Mycena rebaudengoi]|nr:hypothetical protein C8J57DRAFT_1458083 [Mycena rebaudengoi]
MPSPLEKHVLEALRKAIQDPSYTFSIPWLLDDTWEKLPTVLEVSDLDTCPVGYYAQLIFLWSIALSSVNLEEGLVTVSPDSDSANLVGCLMSKDPESPSRVGANFLAATDPIVSDWLGEDRCPCNGSYFKELSLVPSSHIHLHSLVNICKEPHKYE